MVLNNETPTEAQVLKMAIDKSLADVHVSLPAKIISYDGKRASVQPLIQRKLVRDGTVVTLPVITNVPVMWSSTANAIVILPLKKDDTGTLLFSERSLDKWLVSGGLLTPDDPRKFSLSDAQFFPGLKPFNVASDYDPDRVVIKHGETKITMTDNGKVKILNDTGEVIAELKKILDILKTEPMLAGVGIYAAAAVIIGSFED